MEPVDLVTTGLTAMGYGAFVPVVLAVVGLASAISVVYPASWPGASFVHKTALLFGRAKPAIPATSEKTS